MSPDRALREKLYARYLVRAEVEPEAGLVSFLAERPTSSVREIAGVGAIGWSRRRPRWRRGDAGSGPSWHDRRGAGAAQCAAATVHRDVDAFFLDNEKVDLGLA